MSSKSTQTTPLTLQRQSGFVMVVYFIIFFWGMWAGRDFFVPILISTLLAFLIMPIMRFLIKHKVPEWAAITLSTVVLILPFITVAIILVHEAQSLVEQFPTIMKSVNHWAAGLSRNSIIQTLHLQEAVRVSALSQKLENSAGSGAAILLAGLGSILNSVALLVLILIITVVMVASRDHLRRSAFKLLRQFENLHTENILDEVTSLIERFLIARMAIMFISGAASIALIFFFKVPYSFLLGSLIGILTFLPEVGYVLSILPLLIVSIASGHSAGSILLLQALLFIVHIIEGNVLTPKLVGHKLNINVLASFVGLFGGGLLWGVWGMLLSIPIMGVTRIILCTSPELKVWGDLLAEREDDELSRKLIRKRRLPSIFKKASATT